MGHRCGQLGERIWPLSTHLRIQTFYKYNIHSDVCIITNLYPHVSRINCSGGAYSFNTLHDFHFKESFHIINNNIITG